MKSYVKFLTLFLALLAGAGAEGRAASSPGARFDGAKYTASAASPQTKTARRRAKRRRKVKRPRPGREAHAAGGAAEAGRGEKSDANQQTVGGTAMIQSGTWGGKGILLLVNDDGATVEFDCAHGAIERFEVKPDGGFEARGTYAVESLGPQREGAEPAAQPARYAGRVSGDEMTLTVTLADGTDKVGTFSLGRGRHGGVVKCK